MVSKELANYIKHYDLIQKLLLLVTIHDPQQHRHCSDVSLINAHTHNCNRCALMYMRNTQTWAPKKLRKVLASITRSQNIEKMLVKNRKQNEETGCIGISPV